ncbi:uncharacterized protein ASCRUDRAFT_9538 [Ascoidea rubescens DSM 1968]|uniref:TRP C-terminal domain-containing protein n=1 Tax=Ascoidea rubescens DSM 1968 TaxID=1344418 RepID=A0A1D2VCA1_9ASCO|nr:hypothetical protein ASCRUDRAFT_9538 [Ascoidea rubescens DSM 1968]ODV59117.1 hypothetical protein ASCRUDRAFT_9538 [Ascoidea rubescens DSM 1968]
MDQIHDDKESATIVNSYECYKNNNDISDQLLEIQSPKIQAYFDTNDSNYLYLRLNSYINQNYSNFTNSSYYLNKKRKRDINSRSGNNVDSNDYSFDDDDDDDTNDIDSRNYSAFYLDNYDNYLSSSNDSLITDINYNTNKYTTLHVTIEFMSGEILERYLRFCNLLSLSDQNYSYLIYNNNSNSNFQKKKKNYFSPNNVTTSNLNLYNQITENDEDYDDQYNKNIKKFFPPFYESQTITPNFTALTHKNFTFSNVCPLNSSNRFVINYLEDLSSFSKIGSYSIRLSTLSNDKTSKILGCSKTIVTPVLPTYITHSITIITIILLLLIIFFNYFTLFLSPYQESSNPFLLLPSTICNESLLIQLAPMFSDLLNYYQFIYFNGALSLDYPGFYQPLLLSLNWCVLSFYNFFTNTYTSDYYKNDNIYLNSSNFNILLNPFTINDQWKNFILFLVGLILAFFAIYQFLILLLRLFRTKNIDDYTIKPKKRFLFFKKTHKKTQSRESFMKKHNKRSSINSQNTTQSELFTQESLSKFWFKNIYLGLGVGFRMFFIYFASPFLILSLYQFYNYIDVKLNYYDFPRPSHLNPPNSLALSLVGFIMVILWLFIIIYFNSKYILYKKNYYQRKIYSSLRIILIYGLIYNSYKPNKLYFVPFQSLLYFSKSLVIAVIQKSGLAQIVLLALLEILDLFSILIIQPNYAKTGKNKNSILMSIFKIVVLCFNVAFLSQLDISERIKSYIAFTQLVLHALLILITFARAIFCFVKVLSSMRKQRKGILYVGNDDQNKDINYTNSDSYISNRISRSIDIEEKALNNTSHQGSVLFRNSSSMLNELYPTYNGANNSSFFRTPHTSTSFYHTTSTPTPLMENTNSSGINSIVNLDPLLPQSKHTSYDLLLAPSQRRTDIDYSVREADLYKYKGRVLDPDPDVKKLWESRDNNNNDKLTNPLDVKPESSSKNKKKYQPKIFTKMLNRLKISSKKDQISATGTSGFQVMRPHQLVVQKEAGNNIKRENRKKTHSENTVVTPKSPTTFFMDYINSNANKSNDQSLKIPETNMIQSHSKNISKRTILEEELTEVSSIDPKKYKENIQLSPMAKSNSTPNCNSLDILNSDRMEHQKANKNNEPLHNDYCDDLFNFENKQSYEGDVNRKVYQFNNPNFLDNATTTENLSNKK